MFSVFCLCCNLWSILGLISAKKKQEKMFNKPMFLLSCFSCIIMSQFFRYIKMKVYKYVGWLWITNLLLTVTHSTKNFFFRKMGWLPWHNHQNALKRLSGWCTSLFMVFWSRHVISIFKCWLEKLLQHFITKKLGLVLCQE